ncbi:sensor histidine kinase [Galbitalea sp. SE-J8]|uniref:sensor histidine kinase n=1 Tax=Galbitalea sp. SE-J8 TaxID=3054952 RepID=UPI00259CCD4B|nr:sensor histidine kinase [Galbitalea sp. SE-J8]MDM4762272.1 sensor histidine kinase [Galbitalea sp. SE-J8]
MTSEWVRPAPDRQGARRDAIIAVALGVGMGVLALLYARMGLYPDPAPVWVSAIVIAAHTLPLALRRRFPATVAVVISLAFFAAQRLHVPELLVTNIALFLALYTLGAWGRDRRRALVVRALIIVAMFVWIVVELLVSFSDPSYGSGLSRGGVFSQYAALAIVQFLTNALYFGAAYVFGESSWRAARGREELEARTVQLAAERERAGRQAVALDRVRIARELHDVVAHHVSVMGVQAGAARRVLDTDPEQARASLAAIESSARSAVDELHRLLGTLRADDGATDAAAPNAGSSTLGIAQLCELVEASSDAGVPTTLATVGAPRVLTPVAGYALYRVAQEALTNTRKHGGAGVTADVRIRFLPSGVELEVADTGRGTAPHDPAGLGLLGMRERVAAAGGALHTGFRTRGGFVVRATIPESAGTPESRR